MNAYHSIIKLFAVICTINFVRATLVQVIEIVWLCKAQILCTAENNTEVLTTVCKYVNAI